MDFLQSLTWCAWEGIFIFENVKTTKGENKQWNIAYSHGILPCFIFTEGEIISESWSQSHKEHHKNNKHYPNQRSKWRLPGCSTGRLLMTHLFPFLLPLLEASYKFKPQTRGRESHSTSSGESVDLFSTAVLIHLDLVAEGNTYLFTHGLIGHVQGAPLGSWFTVWWGRHQLDACWGLIPRLRGRNCFQARPGCY